MFSNPTWRKAQVLLVGAILAPGQRTVAAALRVMGRSDDGDFARYHEVLNRAVWSPRAAAGILLVLLLQHLDRGDGPLIFGVDETLERRRGRSIGALGVYRDAVRSSRSQVVKASGLRWISLMWLGQVPWAGRHWALPVLTVLAPSARYYQERGRRHKKLTDWARQMVLQLRRWLPQRSLSTTATQRPAALLPVPVGTRYPDRHCVDAALYAPAPPRQPGQNGRPALKGARRPSLKALLEQPPATDQPQVTWTAPRWAGTTARTGLTSQTAWYRGQMPPVRIRWVLIRDPQGAFAPQALLCTDPSDPTQMNGGCGCAPGGGGGADPSGLETQASGPTGHHPHRGPAGTHRPPTRCKNATPWRRAAWYPVGRVDAIGCALHLWLASEGWSPSDPDTQEPPPLCTTDWWNSQSQAFRRPVPHGLSLAATGRRSAGCPGALLK